MSRRVRGSAQRPRAARRRSCAVIHRRSAPWHAFLLGEQNGRCCGFACSRRHPASRRGARHAVGVLFLSLERAGWVRAPHEAAAGVSCRRCALLDTRASGHRRAAWRPPRHPLRIAEGPDPHANASPGVGAADRRPYYRVPIQYKHRTALHAVAATSRVAVQSRLSRGLATSPARTGAAPASLAQDGLRRVQRRRTEKQ